MFAKLLQILGILLFVWLFRSLISALARNSKKPQPAKNTEGTGNRMVKDPVCGMYMDSRLAVRVDNKSEAFYFCSEDCRNKYLSRPPSDSAGSAAAR